MGAKKLLHLFVIWRLRRLMANIFWMKCDIDNRAKRWKARRVSYNVQTFNEPWPTNGLKWDWTFTHPHYFVPSQSIAHPLISINVAPHSDSKWNGIGFVCSSDLKPHRMLSCNCCRVGRFPPGIQLVDGRRRKQKWKGMESGKWKGKGRMRMEGKVYGRERSGRYRWLPRVLRRPDLVTTLSTPL